MTTKTELVFLKMLWLAGAKLVGKFIMKLIAFLFVLAALAMAGVWMSNASFWVLMSLVVLVGVVCVPLLAGAFLEEHKHLDYEDDEDRRT